MLRSGRVDYLNVLDVHNCAISKEKVVWMNPKDMKRRIALLRTSDPRKKEFKTELVRDSEAVIREAATLRIVDEYAAKGRHEHLIGMAENETHTMKVREAAGMKAVNEYAEKRWYSALIKKIATNRKLPWRVRQAAGLEAVEGYALKGYYNALTEIAEDKEVMPHVRKTALSHLELRTTQFEGNDGFVGREELKQRHREIIAKGVFSKESGGSKQVLPRKLKR